MKKKYTKIIMAITLLTPEKAKMLLDGMYEFQRKISNCHIMRYTDAIERGLWLFDGMPIRVDWFGRMFDGQHRCEAVIRTGKAIRVLIIYGLDPETYKVCDRGKTRNFADALRRNGEKYCKYLAFALISVQIYKEKGNFNRGGVFRYTLQTDDILKLLKQRPELRTSIQKVRSVKPVLSVGIAATMHYLFSEIDSAKADEFFRKLATGEDCKKKDPILALRDRLLFDKGQAIKMEREYKLAIIIKAWNAFRQGKPLTKLSWGGPKNKKEPIPKII